MTLKNLIGLICETMLHLSDDFKNQSKWPDVIVRFHTTVLRQVNMSGILVSLFYDPVLRGCNPILDSLQLTLFYWTHTIRQLASAGDSVLIDFARLLATDSSVPEELSIAAENITDLHSYEAAAVKMRELAVNYARGSHG